MSSLLIRISLLVGDAYFANNSNTRDSNCSNSVKHICYVHCLLKFPPLPLRKVLAPSPVTQPVFHCKLPNRQWLHCGSEYQTIHNTQCIRAENGWMDNVQTIECTADTQEKVSIYSHFGVFTPSRHCTLHSITRFQYWNSEVSCGIRL